MKAYSFTTFTDFIGISIFTGLCLPLGQIRRTCSSKSLNFTASNFTNLTNFHRYTHVNKGLLSMLVISEVCPSMKRFFMRNSKMLGTAYTQLANGILDFQAKTTSQLSEEWTLSMVSTVFVSYIHSRYYALH